MRTLKFKAQPTNCVFRYRQSNFRLLPAFDCCRARGDQIVVQSSDNEQSSGVVVSWEDPPNTWLTVAKNAFVGWALNFRVRMLLKGAVISTTFTDTEKNNCFSIYHTSWITSGPKSNFICDNTPTKAILFFFGCLEVNSTWLITSKLANQRSRKALFHLCR